MTSEQRTAFTDALAVIAIDAGKVIMDVFRAGFDVERKDDDSPVTKADRDAERLILARLRELDPGLVVIAEEAASAGHIPDVGDRFALVDPLDGTRSFTERKEDFTVNIAIIEHGWPVIGVVFAPATGRLFVAGGARLCLAGKHQRRRTIPRIVGQA